MVPASDADTKSPAGKGAPLRRTATSWQRLWRRPFFKRAFYEIVGLVLLSRRGMQMLNCGHSAPDRPPLALPPEAEPERLAYQLYHRLGTAIPLRGRDVIETGCGAGAGARFLATTEAPRRYVGTDASRMLIRVARRRGLPPPLEFHAARAERLPFVAASFDLALALEAIHPLPDKSAFLRESARVLRPGGHLVVADFFYRRESSPGSVARFRAALAAAPFDLVHEEDWTSATIAALEADSPRRMREITRLPRVFRRAALAFAGTTSSPLYRQLKNGQAAYLHFVAIRK